MKTNIYTYCLPYAEINILQKDVAEIIFKEGVEVSVGMVEDMYSILSSHLQAPFSCIINSINSYSFSPEAQMLLGTVKEHISTAIVAYSDLSREIAGMLVDFPRKVDWNVRIFSDRSDGLAWVRLQHNQAVEVDVACA